MKLLIGLGFKLDFVPIFHFSVPRSRNIPDLLAVYPLIKSEQRKPDCT